MKLTKLQLSKYIKFLDKCKYYVGFGDWEVILALETKEMEDDYANLDANIYEKELKIQLSDSFLKLSEKKQTNILLHELVHGRVEVHEKRIEEFRDVEEEHMINDIVRGFEKFGKLEFE